MLWQTLGGVGAGLVILGLAWLVTRARGLRHYRLDLHVTVHHTNEAEPEGDDSDPR